MQTSEILFSNYRLGDIELKNRLVMAPLTRSRAADGNVPSPLMAEYYRQRASAGLIIAEATQVSPQGQGYVSTPGIHSEEQKEGWKKITQAVHAAGGRIFLQLWHVGRISHVAFQPGGRAPLAPSAIRADAKAFVNGKFEPVSEPRAIETAEVAEIVKQYADGARRAMEAGFDGVEVHGANGYLVDQFLRDRTNQRTDQYGGSIENRLRFMLEVVEAVATVAGKQRTGIRLSPVTSFGDISDSDPQALFNRAVETLEQIGIAYIHVIEGETGNREKSKEFDYAQLRRRFSGTYMANNGYDLKMAAAALESRRADLICLGRPFISNPDLVERFRRGAPLNQLDPKTLYGGGAQGYTDYPFLEGSGA